MRYMLCGYNRTVQTMKGTRYRCAYHTVCTLLYSVLSLKGGRQEPRGGVATRMKRVCYLGPLRDRLYVSPAQFRV